MTSNDNNASIASLLNLVKTLKQDGSKRYLSASEKESRVFDVIEKLAKFQPVRVQTAPMTLSAEER